MTLNLSQYEGKTDEEIDKMIREENPNLWEAEVPVTRERIKAYFMLPLWEREKIK